MAAPSVVELEAALTRALSELGIDEPGKVPAAAPSGENNAVFDMSARLLYEGPVSPGEQIPTGLELTWTERMLGDYDANGEVGSADIVPLAQYWLATVTYDDPASHDGLDYWPSGDPDDHATGAENWRLARVDGDANTEVGNSDIVTIAQHWHEKLSGYRIYTRGPGEADYTLLDTVAKPVGASAPVRYRYTCEPPAAGVHSYYVIPYSAGEGTLVGSSNIAAVELSAGFADTTAPLWDSAPGVASAVNNGDGTATVTWGSATDVAVAPAPASPPVSYTVYWSTVSPVDSTTAARAEDAVSPWVSPVLTAGQTYYFAVRVRDSASPPNEDTNTVEAEAVITGGAIEDIEPPVFTETYVDKNGEIQPLDMFASIEVANGKLLITCPPAVDALSPPVHYDLHYVSAREADTLYWRDGETNTWKFVPEAQTVEDIPAYYEFPWENRHEVRLALTVRDSAPVPNVTGHDTGLGDPGNYGEFTTAPFDGRQLKLDTAFPPYEPGVFISDRCIADLDQQLMYVICYSSGSKVQTTKLWLTTLDLTTAQWNSQLLYTHTVAEEEFYISNIALNPADGLIYFLLDVRSLNHEDKYKEFHRFNPATGVMDDWSVAVPSYLWGDTKYHTAWAEDFGHNGLPAIYTFGSSSVNPNYSSVHYHWWDEAEQVWVDELACDPGGHCRVFAKPDGTVQLVSELNRIPLFVTGLDEDYSVHERDAAGVWRELARAPGYLIISCPGSFTYPLWNAQVAWVAEGGTGDDSDRFVLSYSSAQGLQVSTFPAANIAHVSEANWPAEGGGWHDIPYYLFNGEKLECYDLSGKNYYPGYDTNDVDGVVLGFAVGNPITGDYALALRMADIHTGKTQTYLRVSTPSSRILSPVQPF